jgi:hypothetical protein
VRGGDQVRAVGGSAPAAGDNGVDLRLNVLDLRVERGDGGRGRVGRGDGTVRVGAGRGGVVIDVVERVGVRVDHALERVDRLPELVEELRLAAGDLGGLRVIGRVRGAELRRGRPVGRRDVNAHVT